MSDVKVPLLRLFERKSASGKTYFTAHFGDAKVVVFKDERCEEPRYGSVAEWQMYACEKGSQQQARARPSDAE